MKRISVILAIALAATVACSKQEVLSESPVAGGNEVELVPMTFTASCEEIIPRASLSADTNPQVVWAEGDQLAVYDGTAIRTFTIKAGEGGKTTAEFEGSAADVASYTAVFPYAAAYLEAGVLKYAVPAAQAVGAQSVDPAALVATATSTDKANFGFTSAVGLLRFDVPAGVNKVIFHTKGKAETLAGDSRAVVVTLPGTAGTFEAAVEPGTYEGIRAFARTASGDFLKAGASDLAVSAGHLKPMGNVKTDTEVVAIETPDEFIAYLGSSPTLDAYVCADLDLTAKTVTTCASYANNFDGQFHSIDNWESAGVALFGTVSGSVSNLTLESGCNITVASGDFSPMVCTLTGSVSGCVNKADFTIDLGDGTTQYCFGPIVSICSAATTLIRDCENYGNIDVTLATGATTMSAQYIGGLVSVVGSPSTSIRVQDCVNHADHIILTATNPGSNSTLKNIYLGGVVAATGVNNGDKDNTSGFTSNYGTVSGCVNHADVEATWDGGTGGYYNIGGIIGYAECAVSGCENLGDISFENSKSVYNARPSVGGIAGTLAGTAAVNANDCINRGDVSLSGDFANAGNSYTGGTAGLVGSTCGGCFGLVGDNTTGIDNCDNYGKVTIDTYMPTGNKSTAYYGGIVGYSKGNISNCDNYYNSTTLSLKIMAYKTYWGGVAGYVGGAMSYCTNASDIVYSCNGVITNVRLNHVGGIGGNVVGAIDHCINEGSLDITFDSNTGYSYAGGICAYHAGGVALSYNENRASGDITIDGGAMVKQIAVAGIVGYNNAASSTYSNCSNAGDISVSNWSNTAFNYVGGIMGSYNSGSNTFTSCSNTGNLSSTATSKMRMGGIASALNGTMTNCTNDCTISMTGGITGSVAGGLMGYCAAAVTGGSSSCTITATGNTGSSAGLLFGDLGGTKTVKNITAGGSITSDAGTAAGFIAGAWNKNTANFTLGAAGEPVNILGSSRVNGAAPSLTEPDPVAGDVLGDTSVGGTITFTNVVIVP